MRFGAGISVACFERHVSLEVIVRDVADARGNDVLGMPLAGRSVTATLGFRE